MSSFLTFMSSWKHRQHFTGNVIDKQLPDGGGGDQKVGGHCIMGALAWSHDRMDGRLWCSWRLWMASVSLHINHIINKDPQISRITKVQL